MYKYIFIYAFNIPYTHEVVFLLKLPKINFRESAEILTTISQSYSLVKPNSAANSRSS